MSFTLIARKLFNNDDDDSKKTCPGADHGPDIVPLIGNMSYRTFASILSGSCALASSLIILILIFQHSIHYSNPIQQRQIIRILLLIAWVSLCSFLIVWQAEAGTYLLQSLDFGCSIAIAAFLLLMCSYILSKEEGYEVLFGEGQTKQTQFNGDSPQWLRKTWYAVLQFVPACLILWLAIIISEAVGTYCAQSKSPHFAHIWIQVARIIVSVVAIAAVLRFCKIMKQTLQPHGVFLKLLSFKGIIGLNVLQTFIINMLYSSDKIKPSNHMTYHDIIDGLPALVLSCELPIFAVLLFVAFSVKPYKGQHKQASAFQAIVDAFNLTDLISAFVRGPMRLIRATGYGRQYAPVPGLPAQNLGA